MLQLLSKSVAIRRTLPSLVRRTFSDDHKPPTDDTNQTPDAKVPEQPANKAQGNQNRLNELLASMSTDSNLDIVKTVVAAAKPKQKADKASSKRSGQAKSLTAAAAAAVTSEADMVQAVKEVAAEIGGDVKQTESELLSKLLNRGGGGEELKINDLISGMQVDRMDGARTSVQPKRSSFVRKSIEFNDERRNAGRGGENSDRPFQRRRPAFDGNAEKVVSVNLFGEKPLGIFAAGAELHASPDILQTWSQLQTRDLALAVTHPPSNHFQKMALWTEQGKLWRFPIDNEQGLDDEATVCFTEHIFLDRHLEGWCPQRGPVRHFMELVCVGLSKNPYYSVQQKIDHITWFRQYFDEKKELLQQVIIDQTAASAAEAAEATSLKQQ